MPTLKEFSKDTLIYGIGSSLNKLIAIFLLPFYTRALSPSDYGILGILNTFVGILSIILGLGLPGATARYFFVPKSQRIKGKILFTSLILRSITGFGFAILVIPWANLISLKLFDSENYSAVVIISAFTIPIGTILLLQEMIYRYFRQPVKYVFITILKALFGPGFGILFVIVLNWGVLGARLGTFLNALIALIFAFLYYAKNKYTPIFSKYWAKKMLNFGFPLIWTGIASWVFTSSDRFFLLHYDSLNSIGLYTIGNTFSQPVILINMAVAMGLTPLLLSSYEEENNHEKPKTKEFAANTWHLYISIAVLLALGLSIFGKDLLKTITTPDYLDAALCIPFFTFGLIFNQSAVMTGNGMTLIKKTKPYFWIMLFVACINVFFNFLLVPNYGFIGAAISNLLSNIFYFGISYYISQKYFFVERKICEVLIVTGLAFLISFFLLFFEMKQIIEINFYLKALVILLFVPIIILTRLVKKQDLFFFSRKNF